MTRTQMLRLARQTLRDAGIESFSLDARLLVLHALAVDELALVRDPDIALTDHERKKIEQLLARRVAREPVARILGQQEFYGLSFFLGPDTLIPRPETEMLVDEALRRIPADVPARILDLGTGTGCILLAILHHRPLAHGMGVDRAAGAVEVARRNAAHFGLSQQAAFQIGDWAEGISGTFDLVVTNPPYIDSAVVPRLAPEVADHDPALALDGGADGLDAYRLIFPALPRLLAADAVALFEIGFDQAGRLSPLAQANGLGVEAVRKDIAGHDRMLVLTGQR